MSFILPVNRLVVPFGGVSLKSGDTGPSPNNFGSALFKQVKYIAIDHSIAIPMVTPKLIIEALNLGADLAESEWNPLLRDWVRAKLSSA